jgi:hypothetical protein
LTRASIHFRKKMDCRVKPGNDRDRFNLNEKCSKLHPPDPIGFMIQTGAMGVGGLASQMMPGRIICRGGFQTRPARQPAFASDVGRVIFLGRHRSGSKHERDEER